jgi:cardiolipin synthase A/B
MPLSIKQDNSVTSGRTRCVERAGAARMRLSVVAIVMVAVALTDCASYGKLAGYAKSYADHDEFYGSRGVPSFPAGNPRLYMDGSSWSARALELIAGAEDYILVSSFLVTSIPRQEDIFDALAARMADGVRVYMIVDSASYYRTYTMDPLAVPAAIPLARSRGIPVIEYNPIRGARIFTLLGLFNRDHRKFWVVDGRLVAVGGQNIDYDSLRDPTDGGLIDAMMEFESAGSAAFLRDSFIHTWNSYDIGRLDPGDFPVREGAKDFPLSVFDQGSGNQGQVTTMFDGFFAFAKEELWLVQCYTYLTPSLIDKIRFAVDRGVKVNFILSDNHVAIRFLQGSFYGMQDLLDAGATVYLYDSPSGSLLHYKLILADDSWAAVGSANYNFRSQTTSRELSVLVGDRESLEQIRAGLDEILRHCRPVGRDEAARYRSVPFFLQNLLMQFWG